MKSMLAMIVLVAAASAAAAADTTIYKVRLKDGSIAFTDRPPPGATILDSRTGAPPAAVLPAVPKSAVRSSDERRRASEAKRDAATAQVDAAERALEKAKADLEKGREPREGDYIGTARKGFTRPSPEYEQRVRTLEQAVAEAEARLAKAREALR